MDLLSIGASGEQGGVAAFCFCATDKGPGTFGVGYVFDEEVFDYTPNAMTFTAKKDGTYTFYGFIAGGGGGPRRLKKMETLFFLVPSPQSFPLLQGINLLMIIRGMFLVLWDMECL